MSTQIAVRIPDEMVAKLDQWVERGDFNTRADAVRAALEAQIREDESREAAEMYRRAYTEMPLTEEEIELQDAFEKHQFEALPPW